MAAAASEMLRPSVLPDSELNAALEVSRSLARLVERGAVRVVASPVAEDGRAENCVLPASLVQILSDFLAHLAEGGTRRSIPWAEELTTQQAAAFLNVSRPWIIKLIESGKLSCSYVGTHRRIPYDELAVYKVRSNLKRRQALYTLVAEAQAMGPYE